MTARWSLQRRLVVALVALLALVSVIVGAVSVLALRESLLQRLDQQVAAELRFVQRSDGPGGQPDPPANQTGDDQGARNSVRLVVVANAVVIAEYADENRDPTLLTAAQQRALLDAVTGPTQTLTLPGLGDFRVRAEQARGRFYIVGLSLDEVASTTTNLVLIFALVTLGALVVAAVLGTRVVRVALRPLGRVAATATRVSELQLAKGEVTLADRVGEEDTDPRTEVGQVGSALNRMLGHIEGALVARQQSEDKVRQFVADASHELRTPLASIRGYSELTRRGDYELPDDVVRALDRIESESVRMTSPRRGPAAARPARRRARARARRGRPRAARRRRCRRRARRLPRSRVEPRCARDSRRRDRRPRAPAPGRGQPARQRARAHPDWHRRSGPALSIEGSSRGADGAG